MRPALATLLSIAIVAGTSSAQSPDSGPTRIRGTVDPATGKPSLEPEGLVVPGSDWPASAREPDAVAKGVAALERCAAAYRSAATLVDRARIRMRLPEGEQDDALDLDFGGDGQFRITSAGIRLCCHGGKVCFVPDNPEDRYLTRDVVTNGNEALAGMLGRFNLPVPDLAFRHPLPGGRAVDAFAGCGAGPDASVTGYREDGGRQHVLVSGNRCTIVASIDPSTSFVRSVEAVLSPDGLPDEVRVGMHVTMDPQVSAPKLGCADDIGARRGVTTLEEMFSTAKAADAPTAAGPKPGSAAPVASLADLDGKQVDLAALRGKVIVLDFWASWCGPCRRGLPLLQQYADEVKGDARVAVFAVNVWEQGSPEEVVAKVRDASAKLKLSLPVLLDRDGALIGKYGFQGIPATVVIAPDGSLVATHMGFSQDLASTLRADVAKALGTAK